MSKPNHAPYGSWKSPITSDVIVSETIGLTQVAYDGDDIYWIEMRPSEGGRNVIVKRTPQGLVCDITPQSFNARTRVHEYGGGAFAVKDGTVYFSNFADQCIYRQRQHEEPSPLTNGTDCYYADATIDRRFNRLLCVQEDHRRGNRHIMNTISSIDLTGKHSCSVLIDGNDFYACPRLSPDGSYLCWLTWNHPNMPWDGSELWVGRVNGDGHVSGAQRVAGGINESIFQPEWSSQGILYFVSDRSGWWNIYRWDRKSVEAVTDMRVEFGRPAWVFRMSTYAFTSANQIVCTFNQQGTWHLANISLETENLELVKTPFTEIEYLCGSGTKVIFVAGSPIQPRAIVEYNLLDRQFSILRRSSTIVIDAGYLSKPLAIEFPTEEGLTAHAFYYAPENKDFLPAKDSQPPLLVMSHGGPTVAATSVLQMSIQYWTSRGFAVVDVNYGGSSGYGRKYRQRLDGQWGVVDVNDCCNAARYLIENAKVDRNALAIRGGSAGGYTTLCALTFKNIFQAGASYYGVSDLEALTKQTHKFESHYLDRLIGPYPEKTELYDKRSPLRYIDQLSCPVIFFQGLEDKIVPPDQARIMVEMLRKKGFAVAYVAFEGEQHGFRRAENIKMALDSELYFYSRIFGLQLADTIEPVHIDNL